MATADNLSAWATRPAPRCRPGRSFRNRGRARGGRGRRLPAPLTSRGRSRERAGGGPGPPERGLVRPPAAAPVAGGCSEPVPPAGHLGSTSPQARAHPCPAAPAPAYRLPARLEHSAPEQRPQGGREGPKLKVGAWRRGPLNPAAEGRFWSRVPEGNGRDECFCQFLNRGLQL